VILTALCGHGHFDLPAYDAYLRGDLVDHTSTNCLAKALTRLPEIDTTFCVTQKLPRRPAITAREPNFCVTQKLPRRPAITAREPNFCVTQKLGSGEGDQIAVVGVVEVLDAVGQEQDSLGLEGVDGTLVVRDEHDGALVGREGSEDLGA
jgi:hypothetical protein